MPSPPHRYLGGSSGNFPVNKRLATLIRLSPGNQTPRGSYVSAPAMQFSYKDTSMSLSLKPLLLVEKESARIRRARYSDPLILHKWSAQLQQAGGFPMGDIGLSDHALPTDEDFRGPFSAPPASATGGAPIQMESTNIFPNVKQGIPVANLIAADFAK